MYEVLFPAKNLLINGITGDFRDRSGEGAIDQPVLDYAFDQTALRTKWTTPEERASLTPPRASPWAASAPSNRVRRPAGPLGQLCSKRYH